MAVVGTTENLRELVLAGGHTVRVAADPSALFEAQVILLDLSGGPVAGTEWLRRVVASARPRPVVVICEDDEVERCLAAGAREVVRRPVLPRLVGLRLGRVAVDVEEAIDPVSGSGLDLWERLVYSAPDPIIASDLSGRILVFNPAAERVLGYPSEAVLGQLHVSEVYADPSMSRRVLDGLRAAETRTLVNRPVRLRTRAGERIPVQLSASLVHDLSGEPVATVGLFRDGREIEALGARVRSLTEQLVSAAERLGRMQDRYTTVFALNQPLTAAMGVLEMMRLGALDPEQSARAERVDAQLSRIAEQVRSLAEM